MLMADSGVKGLGLNLYLKEKAHAIGRVQSTGKESKKRSDEASFEDFSCSNEWVIHHLPNLA